MSCCGVLCFVCRRDLAQFYGVSQPPHPVPPLGGKNTRDEFKSNPHHQPPLYWRVDSHWWPISFPCRLTFRQPFNIVSLRSPLFAHKSYCGHNHDPRGGISRAQANVLPPKVVEERFDDIRKWTAAGVGPTDIFKLLEMDHEGMLLDRDGKRKVSSFPRLSQATRGNNLLQRVKGPS